MEQNPVETWTREFSTTFLTRTESAVDAREHFFQCISILPERAPQEMKYTLHQGSSSRNIPDPTPEMFPSWRLAVAPWLKFRDYAEWSVLANEQPAHCMDVWDGFAQTVSVRLWHSWTACRVQTFLHTCVNCSGWASSLSTSETDAPAVDTTVLSTTLSLSKCSATCVQHLDWKSCQHRAPRYGACVCWHDRFWTRKKATPNFKTFRRHGCFADTHSCSSWGIDEIGSASRVDDHKIVRRIFQQSLQSVAVLRGFGLELRFDCHSHCRLSLPQFDLVLNLKASLCAFEDLLTCVYPLVKRKQRDSTLRLMRNAFQPDFRNAVPVTQSFEDALTSVPLEVDVVLKSFAMRRTACRLLNGTNPGLVGPLCFTNSVLPPRESRSRPLLRSRKCLQKSLQEALRQVLTTILRTMVTHFRMQLCAVLSHVKQRITHHILISLRPLENRIAAWRSVWLRYNVHQSRTFDVYQNSKLLNSTKSNTSIWFWFRDSKGHHRNMKSIYTDRIVISWCLEWIDKVFVSDVSTNSCQFDHEEWRRQKNEIKPLFLDV